MRARSDGVTAVLWTLTLQDRDVVPRRRRRLFHWPQTTCGRRGKTKEVLYKQGREPSLE